MIINDLKLFIIYISLLVVEWPTTPRPVLTNLQKFRTAMYQILLLICLLFTNFKFNIGTNKHTYIEYAAKYLYIVS